MSTASTEAAVTAAGHAKRRAHNYEKLPREFAEL